MASSAVKGGFTEKEDTIYHKYAKASLLGWVLPTLKAGVAVEDILLESLAWALDMTPMQRRTFGRAFAAPGRARRADPEADARRKNCRQEIIGKAEELAGGMPESPWGASRRRFARVFGLKDDELDVCEMAFIIHSFPQVESCLEGYFRIMDPASASFLAAMLGISRERLEHVRRNLESLGLMKGSGPLVFLGNVEALWRNPKLESPAACLPMKGGDILPLEDFAVDGSGLDIARNLLESLSERPAHILLYGGTGTGKTSFIRSLAESCRIPLYPVTFHDGETEQEKRRALEAGFSAAAEERGAVVLVEDADLLLERDGAEPSSSETLKNLLDKPGTRAVWTTTRPGVFDEALKRRFVFSLPFEEPAEWKRVEMWKGELRRQGLEGLYGHGDLVRIVRRHPVSIGLFASCLRSAKEMPYEEEKLPEVLESLLAAHGGLMRNGVKNEEPAEESVFTPLGVSADGPIDEFLAKCGRIGRKLDEARGRIPVPARCATMLFYGPPGTGKTALARHIAETLGKPVVERKASNILGRYVGMNEQAIASAFEEAERKGAVLLIDEADSFLMDRSGADHGWEASMVNEFLTRLESCRCFCVCTTNLKERLDPAAMRRFTFKLRFGYAGPEQALALYRKLLAPWAAEDLSAEQLRRLECMEKLAPGDFGNVRSQIWLEDEGSLPADRLLDLLERECGDSGRC